MITIYDTATGSLNLGDQIIMQAVSNHVHEMFPEETLMHFPTHYTLSSHTLQRAWIPQLAFVGGTNLLQAKRRMRARKNQWSLGIIDAYRMTPAILMGCGWNNYNKSLNKTAIFFYKKALNSNFFQSVRDQFTLNILKQYGIENVLNTGCPTLWNLTPQLLSQISLIKSKKVVFTLTDYSQHVDADIELIIQLSKNYSELIYWPQGSDDLKYFSTLHKKLPRSEAESIQILPRSLYAFDELLNQQDIDYVGTRLHAGIRALQKGCRSIIIGIDNRSLEMKKDMNLPVVEREQISTVSNLLNQPLKLEEISIPFEAIKTWKSQFVNAVHF